MSGQSQASPEEDDCFVARPGDEEEIPIKEVGDAIYDFEPFKNERVHLLIRGVKYEDDFIQKDKTFPRGLSFVNVTFEKEVNFNRSVFNGPLYFWNCLFLHRASFFRVRISDDCHPVRMRLTGEVNFSYSRFEQQTAQEDQPSFDRAQFAGVAFFHRTFFCNGVSMEETQFNGGVRFEGSESDICLPTKLLLDTVSEDLLKSLLSKEHRIFKISVDQEDHCNFDLDIRSSNNLKLRLSEVPQLRLIIKILEREQASQSPQNIVTRSIRSIISIYNRLGAGSVPVPGRKKLLRLGFVREILRTIPSEAELTTEQIALKTSIQNLVRLWEDRFSYTMFNGRSAVSSSKIQERPESRTPSGRRNLPESSFRGAHFGPKSKFSRVDLGQCLFRGTNICEVDFIVVVWATQPCGLLLRHIVSEKIRNLPFLPKTDRAAIRDEFDLDRYVAKVKTRRELTSRRLELSELYRELRISADREGDSQKSRDFYFGELEAQRLSYPVIWQKIGILAWYRRFSGYSKREILALAWLSALIFVIFPLLTCILINRQEYKIFRDLRFTENGAASCEPPALSGNALFPYTAVSPLQAAANPQLAEADRQRYNKILSRAADSVWGNGTYKSLYLRIANSSLQASTFLPSPTQTNALDSAVQIIQGVNCQTSDQQNLYFGAAIKVDGLQGWRKGLEGIERLIVPAQLGLFFVALRSKFQRTR